MMMMVTMLKMAMKMGMMVMMMMSALFFKAYSIFSGKVSHGF